MHSFWAGSVQFGSVPDGIYALHTGLDHWGVQSLQLSPKAHLSD